MLFNSVNWDWDGRKIDKTSKRSVIEMLSIKTIKLRIGWLFSKYREKEMTIWTHDWFRRKSE